MLTELVRLRRETAGAERQVKALRHETGVLRAAFKARAAQLEEERDAVVRAQAVLSDEGTRLAIEVAHLKRQLAEAAAAAAAAAEGTLSRRLSRGLSAVSARLSPPVEAASPAEPLSLRARLERRRALASPRGALASPVAFGTPGRPRRLSRLLPAVSDPTPTPEATPGLPRTPSSTSPAAAAAAAYNRAVAAAAAVTAALTPRKAAPVMSPPRSPPPEPQADEWADEAGTWLPPLASPTPAKPAPARASGVMAPRPRLSGVTGLVEAGGRPRRSVGRAVTYKEPSLVTKLRRRTGGGE